MHRGISGRRGTAGGKRGNQVGVYRWHLTLVGDLWGLLAMSPPIMPACPVPSPPFGFTEGACGVVPCPAPLSIILGAGSMPSARSGLLVHAALGRGASGLRRRGLEVAAHDGRRRGRGRRGQREEEA